MKRWVFQKKLAPKASVKKERPRKTEDRFTVTKVGKDLVFSEGSEYKH